MKTRSPPGEQRERAKLFLPIFIATILIMSTFGIILGGFSSEEPTTPQGENIGGAYFSLSQGRWVVQGSGYVLNLQYGPEALRAVEAVDINPLRQVPKLYVSYKSGENTLSAVPDFYQNMKQFVQVTPACVEDGPGCEELPLKTCADADSSAGVVMLTLSSAQSVTQEGTCYSLQGDAEYLTKIIDRLLLAYVGVNL